MQPSLSLTPANTKNIVHEGRGGGGRGELIRSWPRIVQFLFTALDAFVAANQDGAALASAGLSQD